MFIPGCLCCGTPPCSCYCENGIAPFYVRLAIGSPTSFTGSAASAEELAAIATQLNGRVCIAAPSDSCSWQGSGNYNYGVLPQNAFSTINVSNNNCNGWTIRAGALDYSVIYYGYPEPWVLIKTPADPNLKRSAFKTDIVSEPATGDLNAIAQMCSITGEVELPFWSASGAHFTVTIDRTPAGSMVPYYDDLTVLQYGNAKFYRGPGCPICACTAPCQRNAVLNGVTYDCLPPELTVSLSVIRNEGYFPNQNGDTTYGPALTQAVLTEINDLPNMTVPLVSWNGNAATYRYDYPLESNGTKMRYEVTIYCSTVCQPTNSLNTACVKVFLVNTSTATPTPSPAWIVDAFTNTSGSFSKTVSEVNFWYTGNYITDFLDDFGPPSPILTINYTCGNVNQNGYSVYDASSAQDTGGSSIAAGPFTFFGGSTGFSTIYTDIAYITAEAPT